MMWSCEELSREVLEGSASPKTSGLRCIFAGRRWNDGSSGRWNLDPFQSDTSVRRRESQECGSTQSITSFAFRRSESRTSPPDSKKENSGNKERKKKRSEDCVSDLY